MSEKTGIAGAENYVVEEFIVSCSNCQREMETSRTVLKAMWGGLSFCDKDCVEQYRQKIKEK